MVGAWGNIVGLIGSILAVLVDVTLYGAFFLVKGANLPACLLLAWPSLFLMHFHFLQKGIVAIRSRCYLKWHFVMYYALCCIKAVGIAVCL